MPSISISIPKAPSNAYRARGAIGSPSLSSASSSPSKESFFASSSYSSNTSVDSKDLYVPVHKRTRPHIYSRDALLALADTTITQLHDSIRSTLRETYPEIVMNRKMRKSVEYKRNHAVDAVEEKKVLGATPSAQRRAGVLSPFRRSPVPSELEHSRTGVVTAMRKPAPEQERRSGVPSALRSPNARMSRAVGRAPEGRKIALMAASEEVNWRT
ncbi:hypothetical protein K443DRAFT_685194 [Laccaria amethystina LaAM-08-1]|uniref:Uncharacterized protein n=1 Tax=Laccaria amethystina LaAM-08-1 TaxID=1095629 RepID=A0A0C9X4J3_9AGAR|nr:hypothetical protein K443DRAFT_685194 [Laccaria amethystina LaAM-08-1]